MILIDNGSSDNYMKIVENYVRRDTRAISIHQKNKRVSAARNAWLKIARGRYISFIDADDWVDLAYFNVVLERMRKKMQSVYVVTGLLLMKKSY